MKPAYSDLFSKEFATEERDAAWQGIGHRRLRFRRVRVAKRAGVSALLTAGMLAVLVFVLRSGKDAPFGHDALTLSSGAPLPAAWSTTREVISFADGSRIEMDLDTRIVPRPTKDASRMDLGLERGTATFDIRPGGPRTWSIDAGRATVRVLGTRFTVTRTDTFVRVSVERGKVRVEGAEVEGGGRELSAGESLTVEPKASEPSPSNAASRQAHAPTAATSLDPASEPRDARDEQDKERVAYQGKARRTRAAATKTEPSPSSEHETAPEAQSKPSSIDRFAAADEARRTGQSKQAVGILERMVNEHDARSAMAAFTLGKVYADDLGDPASGATWFDRAQTLGLPQGLDEDALARSVECYRRSGQRERAQNAATRYEAHYPEGRHLARVRRWASE
jgi:transmembrane sensor